MDSFATVCSVEVVLIASGIVHGVRNSDTGLLNLLENSAAIPGVV